MYLYHGYVATASDIFCKYWLIFTSALNICSVQLNAYLSIERYLLIFHSQFLQKYKIILHYLPIIILIISPFFFMIGMVNYYPCENHFDYTSWACGTACYTLQPIPSIASWIYALLAPLFIICTSNILLIVRVIYQKRRMLQRNVWKKNKKMLLQLLSVTGVLYVSWVPISISSVITVLHPNQTLYELQGNWLLVGLIYLAVLFSPLSSSMAMPELRNEIRLWINRWLRRYRNAQTYPAAVTRLQTE
ncbi:unnamed protein product [Adineta steineri]|uniref:G-protein coupled receptors family 1 profile domain-containing protein n=2 Tax=Adineta steineri TaxID=433720 RepID=A0A819IUU6_9BILA|nr:unnamed protein product [Adineta steineri]